VKGVHSMDWWGNSYRKPLAFDFGAFGWSCRFTLQSLLSKSLFPGWSHL
jgi:hypothetical protein